MVFVAGPKSIYRSDRMPCPFPGMDPYLELQPFWSDFAPDLLVSLRNALLPKLLPRYDVRIEEYLYVMHEQVRLHRIRPDVTIAATPAWQPEHATTVVAEAVTAELDYPEFEPRTQRHLRIVHLPEEQLVTVVELLSPTNKAAGEDGIDAYLEKRAEMLASRVNLIEIDLLRGGERLPMQGSLPPGDYYIFIGRVGRRPRCQVVGWWLRNALPTVFVPLLEGDPDAELDVAAAFRAAYDQGLYDRRLPYHKPLTPAPSPEDEQWIRQRLSPRGMERASD